MPETSLITDRVTRFNLILDEYGRFMSNTIAQLCPKDLGLQFSDIEQDARLRLWRAIESEREIRDLASYIYRIAATTTIDAIRRIKARREEQLRLIEDDVETGLRLETTPENAPDQVAQRNQVLRKIQAALSKVAENRRAAVGLYLEGMGSHEIAVILGWSEPKTRNLLYRGLGELRKFLREEGIEYEAQ